MTGRLFGNIVALTGMGLLASGLIIPRGFGAALWQTLLGLLLLVLGFGMVLLPGESNGRGLAILVGILGIVIFLISIVPQALLGISLYGSLGFFVRFLLGLLLCVVAYVIIVYGGEITGPDDDF